MLLTIKDTGIGIPAEQLDNIFEMFSQLDRSLERLHAGLGIGLTLVKRLVEMHGGIIRAYSRGVDQGSEFIVRMPVIGEAVSEPQAPRAAKPRQPAQRSILVVDDNRDSATSLATLLRAIGDEAMTAYDGVEALEVAGASRPDVILLDIGMPKLNGYDVCRRIREQPWGQAALIIAVSGWGQDEDRRKSREAGFDHHLVKPLAFATLMELLEAETTS